MKYGARLLDQEYGEIGMIGPYDTRDEAVDAGFKANAGNHPVGANGRPVYYDLINVSDRFIGNVVALGRNNNSVFHLVVGPIMSMNATRWYGVVGDGAEWRHTYHRKDRPGVAMPWPVPHEDQI